MEVILFHKYLNNNNIIVEKWTKGGLFRTYSAPFNFFGRSTWGFAPGYHMRRFQRLHFSRERKEGLCLTFTDVKFGFVDGTGLEM